MNSKPGRGTDLYRYDGIKSWPDGSNQDRGYQRENYLGTNDRGAMNYTPEQLTAAIRRAHQGGWQVGVHANGDATIDAYETVLKETPRDDHRHRIEHYSIFHEEQMQKAKTLGCSPHSLLGMCAGGARHSVMRFSDQTARSSTIHARRHWHKACVFLSTPIGTSRRLSRCAMSKMLLLVS